MILRFTNQRARAHLLLLCYCSVLLRECTAYNSVAENPNQHGLVHSEVRQSEVDFTRLVDKDSQQHTLGLPELDWSNGVSSQHSNYPDTYEAVLGALDVMQSHYFQVAHGTWPQAIDWTAAVMGTQVSATLSSMTQYTVLPTSFSEEEGRDYENLINRYFTQITTFYFGENAFSLRTQAYDDMLWVVLDWLEVVKFIETHSSLHYSSKHGNKSGWYARQFIPQYAHRAHLFYNLASHGWDEDLCGGGMTWNPHLTPYKNAITNELYVAASIGMYLHFPGDSDSSPFTTNSGHELPPAKAHDVRYLDNAVKAYKWLKESGMKNKYGLYADGFHIKGWRGGKDGSNGTMKCDLREEHVYTYNQGVVLSGLRGLWIATSSRHYLLDGHELIESVIAASGWKDRDTEQRWRWAGLGRGGVLEEQCDWSGTCTQNGQAFKGIFFHHLTLFCAPLPSGHDDSALHQHSCDGYADWIRRNALAAYVTRDEQGEFGEWWGRPSRQRGDGEEHDVERMDKPSNEGIDYRNQGIPWDEIWRLPEDDVSYKSHNGMDFDRTNGDESMATAVENPHGQDINDRGRGRTVETQSGGLAVLRALWNLVESRRGGSNEASKEHKASIYK
ncbi:hypothetical protein MMC21_000571 [Puttea exsequens]|nr:hypothetical protein [Puttea exsequens]